MDWAWVTWKLIELIWIWLVLFGLFIVLVIHVFIQFSANRKYAQAQHHHVKTKPYDWAEDSQGGDTREYEGLAIDCETASELTAETPIIRSEWLKP